MSFRPEWEGADSSEFGPVVELLRRTEIVFRALSVMFRRAGRSTAHPVRVVVSHSCVPSSVPR